MGSVTGIDPTDKCVQLAEKHLSLSDDLSLKERVKYSNTTLEQFIEEKKQDIEAQSPDGGLFDLVCCSEVVEHVDNQKDFLANCAKLVKPRDGYLFVSTIAKTPESYFLTILSKSSY